MKGSMKKKMNHLKRYWHEGLATESFLTPGTMTLCSGLLAHRNITPFRNYTASWDYIMPKKKKKISKPTENFVFRVHHFLKINPCLPDLIYFCLSAPEVCMEAAHDDDNGGKKKQKNKTENLSFPAE